MEIEKPLRRADRESFSGETVISVQLAAREPFRWRIICADVGATKANTMVGLDFLGCFVVHLLTWNLIRCP